MKISTIMRTLKIALHRQCFNGCVGWYTCAVAAAAVVVVGVLWHNPSTAKTIQQNYVEKSVRNCILFHIFCTTHFKLRQKVTMGAPLFLFIRFFFCFLLSISHNFYSVQFHIGCFFICSFFSLLCSSNQLGKYMHTREIYIFCGQIVDSQSVDFNQREKERQGQKEGGREEENIG